MFIHPPLAPPGGPPCHPGAHRSHGSVAAGFTLIELLVALAVMAMLALLSWRSLDNLNRAQDVTQERSDQVLRLQASLGQWNADLDALAETGELDALSFDGRVLRMTRRDSTEGGVQSPGLRVVAWARLQPGAGDQGVAQWVRWQSAPVRQRDELARAWERAAIWGQGEKQEPDNTNEDDSAIELVPIDGWELAYHRGDSWGNPLSSVGNEGIKLEGNARLPNGVRLTLTLSTGQSLSGPVVVDWVKPTLAAGSP